MIDYRNVSESPDEYVAQAENKAFLRQGLLQGDGSAVPCLYANTTPYCRTLLTGAQAEALHAIEGRLFGDETLGTMEIYENRAFNVYLKRNKQVVGYFIYREDT